MEKTVVRVLFFGGAGLTIVCWVIASLKGGRDGLKWFFLGLGFLFLASAPVFLLIVRGFQNLQ